MAPQVETTNRMPAGAEPELVEEWTAFLRTMDRGYQQVADQRGHPYVPLNEAEVRAAAGLAAALTVRPRDAVARLPAWCALRPRLRPSQRPPVLAMTR